MRLVGSEAAKMTKMAWWQNFQKASKIFHGNKAEVGLVVGGGVVFADFVVELELIWLLEVLVEGLSRGDGLGVEDDHVRYDIVDLLWKSFEPRAELRGARNRGSTHCGDVVPV